MLSRRALVKSGLVAGGYAFATAPNLLASIPSSFWDDPKSPSLTPFVSPLPLPPPPKDVRAFEDLDPECVKELGTLPTGVSRRTRFNFVVAEEAVVSMHPELPPTRVWRYRDVMAPRDNPYLAGPTFVSRMGEPRVVRMINRLPQSHTGFGRTTLTTHLHGGHVPAFSDGFPDEISDPHFDPVFAPPGHPIHKDRFDYCWLFQDVGWRHGEPCPEERPSTLWYHDHFLDFTGPNVYRGLAGFNLVYDDLDTGDEQDPSPKALRLPSGPYDIPLVLQDKLVAPDGQLLYLPGNFDGFLGDTHLVNGAVQPYLAVDARKYRFRVLNGANARMYQLFLTDASGDLHPFDIVATGGGLLSRTVRDQTTTFLSNATRREIIVDFSEYPPGTELYLEDRIVQDDGRGPDGKFMDLDLQPNGIKLMKFIVGQKVPDPSQVPDELRELPPIPASVIASAQRRTFEFERRNGSWVINDEQVDLERAVAQVPLDTPQVWRLVNKSGGWWHPVHVHLEMMRILSREDEPMGPLEGDGLAKTDTAVLGPNSEVEVFFNFRDYPGPWVFHCHIIEHEDHFMMARFDVG